MASLNENQLALIRNEEIGFIFQGFNLIPGLTAFENVELPLVYRRIEKPRRRKLALEALQKVGLAHRIKHLPSQMSRRPSSSGVAIARAIAASPPLILADEPTGNLDSASGAQIFSDFKAAEPGGKNRNSYHPRRLYCPLRPAHYQNSRRQNSQKLRAGIH